MTHSFPHRMLAVLARTVLALAQDPLATLADIAFWVSLTFVFWSLRLLIKRFEAWIAGRLADHRDREERRAFDEIVRHLGDDFPAGIESEQTQFLPGVTHLGRPAPARQIRRRRMPGVRIPGRPSRRTHSNPKRKARS